MKKKEALPRDEALWMASHRDSNLLMALDGLNVKRNFEQMAKLIPKGDFQARGALIMIMIGSLFSEPMRLKADTEPFGAQQS